jgi:hypothetical protein
METCTYEEELVGRITVVRGVEDLATSRNDGMGDTQDHLRRRGTPRP